MTVDFLASVVAFLITIMILSYLIGDNPLFRLAVSVFVGVAAGFVAAVAWWQVLLPKLILPLLAGQFLDRAMLAVPLVLSGLLLMKAWPPLSRLGAPALGLLIGVASAVAVGGALRGTLIPQLSASVDGLSAGQTSSLERLADGAFVLVGLVASLVYFQFSAGVRKDGSIARPRVLEWVAALGGALIAITLGILFSGVYSAAVTALIERLHFLLLLVGLE
jgi:hypothetical protein